MNNDLASLVKLQQLDMELDALEKQGEDLRQEIDRLNVELKASSAQLEVVKSGLTKLQLRKKALEMEIDSQEQQVKKLQGELNNVKTNEAYKTLLKEIEGGKAAKNTHEEELLDVLQNLEDAQKDIKQKEQSQKAEEQTIRARISELETSLKELLGKIKEKTDSRRSFSTGIAEPLRARYDSIRKSKGGNAVVPIRGDSCGGCRHKIPLHLINEVAKAQSLVFCDTCARILFLEASANPTPATS